MNTANYLQPFPAYRPKNVIAVITRFPEGMSEILKESLSLLISCPRSITGLRSGFSLHPTEGGGLLDIEYAGTDHVEFVFCERENLCIERTLHEWATNFLIGKTRKELIDSGLNILYFEPDAEFRGVKKAWEQRGVYVTTTGHVDHGRRLDRAQENVQRTVHFSGAMYIGDDVNALAQTELDRMNSAGGIDTSKFAEFKIDTTAPTLKTMTESRDQAYRERNQLVAVLARFFPAGIRKTEIPDWEPEWQNCVYIDLPSGQISYHYHDSEAALFADLPPYWNEYDGHSKEGVHARLNDSSTRSMLKTAYVALAEQSDDRRA